MLRKLLHLCCVLILFGFALGRPGGVQNIVDNQNSIDQETNLIGNNLRQTDGLRIPVDLSAPIGALQNNEQSGIGGIDRVLNNDQEVLSSSNLVGTGNRNSQLGDIPIQGDLPIEAISRNVQVTQGKGDVNNIQRSNQLLEQQSNLIGADNRQLIGVELPVSVDGPIKAISSNKQIGQEGNINNFQLNEQTFDQSSNLIGANNRELNAVQGAVSAVAPVSALHSNTQIQEKGDSIKNVEVIKQNADQSTTMIGSNQSQTNLLTTAILAAAPIKALTSNKQIVKRKSFSATDLSQLSKEQLINMIQGFSSGSGNNGNSGITSITGAKQETDASDTMIGDGNTKTDVARLLPQAIVAATAITRNTQVAPDGEIQNVKLREQNINTDTTMEGSDNRKTQVADVGGQVMAIADIINANKQSTGGGTGGASNIDIKKQEIDDRIDMDGDNNKIVQLLKARPQTIVDLGLVESDKQITGGGGSAKNADIIEQKIDDSVTMTGDNNALTRGIVATPQIAARLNIAKQVKQVVGFVTGQEPTDEECVVENESSIRQEQISDVTQKGTNNRVTDVARVGPQVAADVNIGRVIQKVRCKSKTTTPKPSTPTTTTETTTPTTTTPTTTPTTTTPTTTPTTTTPTTTPATTTPTTTTPTTTTPTTTPTTTTPTTTPTTTTPTTTPTTTTPTTTPTTTTPTTTPTTTTPTTTPTTTTPTTTTPTTTTPTTTTPTSTTPTTTTPTTTTPTTTTPTTTTPEITTPTTTTKSTTTPTTTTPETTTPTTTTKTTTPTTTTPETTTPTTTRIPSTPTPTPTPTTTRPPIRRCYRRYCRKWKKMRYYCF